MIIKSIARGNPTVVVIEMVEPCRYDGPSGVPITYRWSALSKVLAKREDILGTLRTVVPERPILNDYGQLAQEFVLTYEYE